MLTFIFAAVLLVLALQRPGRRRTRVVRLLCRGEATRTPDGINLACGCVFKGDINVPVSVVPVRICAAHDAILELAEAPE